MDRGCILVTVLWLAFCWPFDVGAQQWSTNFGSPPTGKGLDCGGSALLEYDGRLIVTGCFTQAGSVAATRIAAWDGTEWAPLGGGIIETGEALAEHGGDLIAAGGGGPPNTAFLMRWNGTTWSTIPSPPGDEGVFWSVCSFDGLLFVGSHEDGVSKLSWWNGVGWGSVPLPLDVLHTSMSIQAMAVYHGQLFLTGQSYGTNGYDGFLLSWDGNAFAGPGFALPALGTSLHTYRELLYVGVDSENGVAIWDQSNWIPFGLATYAWGMETYRDQIVLAGSQVASYNGITYNGQNQQQLGGCIFASDVKEFHGNLYVVGVFDQICTENGMISSSNIAKWSEPATGVGGAVAARELHVMSTPNPFNPTVVLSISVPSRSDVRVFIVDATGRVVRRLEAGVRDAGPCRITWDGTADNGAGLASGVYFAKVAAGGAKATAKLVLLK